MAQVKRNTTASLRLQCDYNSDSFIVRYTNQGEPYRPGISIGVENQDFDKEVIVMLEDCEARQLRDLLIKLYPFDSIMV